MAFISASALSELEVAKANDENLLHDLIFKSYFDFCRLFKFRHKIDFDYYIIKKVTARCALDFERIKLHHNIDTVDGHKMAAYLARWISALSPIRVVLPSLYDKQQNHYLNHIFSVLTGVAIVNFEKDKRAVERPNLNNKHVGLTDLRFVLADLLYTMKYGRLNADLLSIIYFYIDVLAGHPDVIEASVIPLIPST